MNELQRYRQMHYEKFGVAPLVIGLFWDAPGMYIKHLRAAIENNRIYNELELLSEEELNDYRMGRLNF